MSLCFVESLNSSEMDDKEAVNFTGPLQSNDILLFLF